MVSVAGLGAQTASKIRISYWFFPIFVTVPGYESNTANFGDWENFMIEEFKKVHPEIEIVPEMQTWAGGVDKINVAIAGGNPPDIVFDYLGRTGGWFLQGAGVPIDNLISKNVLDDILPTFKDLYTINGKLHGYPAMAWIQMQLFNKFLYNKYGVGNYLPANGTSQTIDDFKARLIAAKRAFPKGVAPYSLACGSEQGDYVWWEFIWGFGGTLFDQNGKIAVNTPETVEAFKFLLSLDKEGLITPGVANLKSGDILNLIYSNKSGGWAGNKGNYSALVSAVKQGTIEGPAEISLYPFPTKPGITPKSAVGPTGFIIMSKDPAKQKAAATFIEFCLQPKYMAAAIKAAGQLPATKSIASMNIYKGDPLGEVMQEVASKYPAGNFGLSNPNYNKIRTELSAQLQAMFSGLKSPEKTAADLEAALKKIIGE